MAASGVKVRKVAIASLCLQLSFFVYVNGYSSFPTREAISKWAELFQNRLLKDFDKFTGMKNLEKKYDDLRKAKLIKVEGHSLVHRMSHELTKNLERKMEALERLVAAAEATVKNYKYDSLIKKDTDVTFVKMKDFKSDDPRLVYSEKFKNFVNFSYSGVHIPVEIYEEYPDILNGLKWSAALDDIFKLNAENDSDIMWQYFGSQTGFMRTYPAHEWIILPRKPNFPDLYDVRLRPWYVHASSSPKDMIILMDSSGSMHGQTMEIMKIAVKTLLTTLGENDFVNIAFFNNTAEWITCFDTLVQANRRTKQILSRGVDELDDGGMAQLSLGLDFAFQAFAKFRENRTEHWAGANCNQIIMLFSDGGTEEAWEVLEKYNYDKGIRIFTYAIGPHPVPYATLKEIACTNRGFFTSIQAMGAVRTKIQDYVKVLGRPLALSSEKNFAWTNFYVDPNGLGMMTTVTLPVFNRTHGENQSIVGVMGVDVALERSMDYEPSYEIGPPGYSFGINRNGYVVFHPDLKTDTIFTDEPPHLDFMDVEIHSTAKEEVRNAMINMRTSKRALSSLIRMPNGKHIVRHHMEYYYTPVNKTSFSIAVVIPTDRTHFLVVEGKDIQEGLELREDEMRGMYLAPWKYCYKIVMKLNISDLLKNFSDTAATRPEMCRMHLLQRLVWDIQNTEDVMNYWASEELEFKRKGVVATFVQSEGGLTRIYPPSEGHRLAEQINPSRSLFYQRAFYGDDYVFIPPDNGFDYSPNQSDAVITVVKSISFSRSGITYKPAIVGVMVDPLWLQPYLLNTPSGPGKVPVSCGDVDHIICYLIDDGGFIISTNQPDMWKVLGKFLGDTDTDAEIMTELYEKQIYARNEDFNYEDRCKKEVKVSAGFRLSALPFRSTLSAFNIGWLFDLSAWSQLIYWLLSFFAFARIPKSEALPEFYELSNETTCNTHEAQYFWGRWGRSYSGDIICNNCTRHYSLAKVGQLNVLLLVTSKPCAPLFCDPVPPPLQAKEEVISPNITNCERLRDVPLRYRKRPDKCYYYSVDENNSECGAVGTLALPHLALIIELISFFIVTKIVHMDDNIPFAAHY